MKPWNDTNNIFNVLNTIGTVTADDVDMTGYQSPVQLLQSRLATEIDDNILKAVHNVGVEVDKDELIRALQYDRGQYAAGYLAGREAANHGYWMVAEPDLLHPFEKVIECSVCHRKHYYPLSRLSDIRLTCFCPDCGAEMDEEG